MLGSKIKEYRELKNLTQEELAEMLYISPKTLGHYETGVRDCRKLDVLAALTKTLDFSVIIKGGKVYIEEDTKMNDNILNDNVIVNMEGDKMDKNKVKSEIMDKYSDIYMRAIRECCFWRNVELSESENRTVEMLFNSVKCSDIFKIVLDNKLISLESGVYESDKYILLDLRAFDEMQDEMIDAFMVVYNKEDLSICEDEVDDVWDFADWEIIG